MLVAVILMLRFNPASAGHEHAAPVFERIGNQRPSGNGGDNYYPQLRTFTVVKPVSMTAPSASHISAFPASRPGLERYRWRKAVYRQPGQNPGSLRPALIPRPSRQAR